MYSPEPHRIPFRMLFTEQFRVTGFALVREGMLAGAALALICIVSLLAAMRYAEQLYFDPELLLPTLFVAALLPFAVWKGDRPFDCAMLWTLPVHRQQAAAAKVLAGATWLMLAMLVTFSALALVALASGGGIGQHRIRMVETVGGAIARQGWRTPAWMWLIPFASTLILYFIGSALVLGLRHPVRSIAGLGAGLGVLVALITNLAPQSALEQGIERARLWLLNGTVGVDLVLSGGEDRLSYWRPGADDRYVQIWRALPDVGGWALAAAFWLGLALVALGLAIRRHRER